MQTTKKSCSNQQFCFEPSFSKQHILRDQRLEHISHFKKMNFFDGSPLSLDTIRQELVKLEDSIIFAFIDRAQFAHNEESYQKNHFQFKGFENKSFLEYFLYQIECVHATVRRYTSPDEYPFFDNLPEPILPSLEYPKILAPNNLNVNSKILDIYVNSIVPAIARKGNDKNYGSTATIDVEALQLLSRRIHFGKFVAEAKFNDPKYHDKYVELIKARDSDGIMELLTNKAVEERVLKRLRIKAETYGQEIELAPSHINSNTSANSSSLTNAADSQSSEKRLRISPDTLADLYEQFVIPLTKEVEVEYLLARLDVDHKPVI